MIPIHARIAHIAHLKVKILHPPHEKQALILTKQTLCKKASNHHANLPLEMYSFTL